MNTEGTDLLRVSPRTFRRTMVRTVAEPSLYLDFTASNQLDPRITFTRASSATFFDQLGVLQTAASGAARFTYDPATLQPQGLLIEEQRTNFCLDSADLAAGDRGSSTGWYAITRASIVSNTVISPDGTLTADKIVANTDNNTHFAGNRTTAGSTTNTNPITVSGFFKAAEFSTCSLLIVEGTTYSRTSQVYFDLSAGTATTPSTANGAASASATITPVGNGWYRCTFTVTLGGSDTRVEIRAYPTNSTSTVIFAGNNFDGVYAWGFQIEAGAFPTSYVPTTTTALTRNADAASMTGTNFSSWFNPAEGTLFAEGENNTGATSLGITSIDDGTINNRMTLRRSSANNLNCIGVVSGAAQWNNSGGTWNSGQNRKAILGYKTDDVAFTVGGASVLTDTSCLIPTVTTLRIGSEVTGAANPWNGTIRRLAFYPVRLSNAQLVALTG